MAKRSYKELTTVTTLSKLLAVLVFLIVPIIAFYAGVNYQQSVTPKECVASYMP